MKYALFILYLLLNAPIFAQVQDTVVMDEDGLYVRDEDGTVVRIGQGGIQIFDDGDSIQLGKIWSDEKRNVRTRWILMDIGTDLLITEDDYVLSNGVDPFELNTWKSTNVNLHLFQQRINLIDHRLNLKWGLTFQFHKYYFDNPVVLEEDTPQAMFTYYDNPTFDKNRLSSTYLTMPIMLNFETNPNRRSQSFRFNIGAYGGPRLGANFKTKGNGDKNKVKDDFNLEKWRIGLRAEIGYGWFNIYGTLALNDLFQESKNNGYVVTPASIGFILIPF